MQKEESSERGERDARQSRKDSGSDLGRVANESDLAVRTKDFVFQLSENEWKNLRYQIGTSNLGHGGRRSRPYVFTEQGAAMLSINQ